SAVGGGCRHLSADRRRAETELLAQLAIHASEHILVLLEEATHIFAALADAFALEAVPCAALLDDIVQHGQVQRVPLARDALAVKNVELGIAEWRVDLVLDHLDFV